MQIAITKNVQPGLWSDDLAIPLERIDIKAELALPVSVTRQRQDYINHLQQAIEARYVFPLPCDAVILGLEIHIGEQTLHGIVKAKDNAERQYESALVEGDGAFLLRRLDDGLYQINLGNIAPSKRVSITVTWAETLRWTGGQIRYRLPNIVGPHYGMAQQAGIALTDVPRNSARAAYELSFSATLIGELARAKASSPSHALQITQESEKLFVSLTEDDWMSRRLTLILALPLPPALVAWSAPDGDRQAIMATCHAPASNMPQRPHHVTLLIDGSGSMSGVSIDQARIAAEAIVHQLTESDTCALAAFGSDTHLLTDTALQVGKHRQLLLSHCSMLSATLGGTEMMSALNRVIPMTPEGGDILLVTDGQLYASSQDIKRFLRYGRRLFVVGVGHSASEKLLRQLADGSGGYCVLVSPNESMAEHIVQHFQRMKAPRLAMQIHWPAEVERQSRPPVIFSNDTAIFCSRIENATERVLVADIGQQRVECTIRPAQGLLGELLPRLVATALLPDNNIPAACQEAVHYQLLTEHTALIAVHERHLSPDEVDLPVIIDVPQMEVASFNLMASPHANQDVCVALNESAYLRQQPRANATESLMNVPELLKHVQDLDSDWLYELNERLASSETLSQLLQLKNLPKALQYKLQGLSLKWSEQEVVLSILTLQLESLPMLRLIKLRKLHMALRGILKNQPLDSALKAKLQSIIPSSI